MEIPNKILIIEDNVAWAESYRRWIGDQFELKLNHILHKIGYYHL